MRWVPPALVASLLAVSTCLRNPTIASLDDSATRAVTSGPEFLEEVRPLLKTYCFECHNTTKRKAGLDLEEIDTASTALEKLDLWDQVAERVKAGEMPPAKRKQPTDKEKELLMAWAKHAAASRVDYDKLPKEQLQEALAGPPASRRLNRYEYNNTLRDLFGVDLRAGELLPSEGGGGEGFDNAGATLFTTPVLMEKYLEAAELVLKKILPTENDTPPADTADDLARLAAARRAILIARPGADVTPREAARKVFEAFVPRAFRRPAEPAEIDRYLGIFEKAFRRGDPYDQSIRLAIKGVLISPSFLFLIETPAEKKGTYLLNQYEIASHLSYFLWSSMPDEKLLGPRCRTRSSWNSPDRAGCTKRRSCANR
jgi:hypothetical protein